MELKITFPGGKKVNAELRGRSIPTDQPVEVGGEGSAPEPYALFAASIGTCAGFYALTFCQSRGLSTEGLAIRQRMRFEGKRLVAVELDIDLPRGFPEKYREPLIRAADGCAVKKAIQAQPEIVVRTVPAAAAEAA
jgi:ribosomal protein S12 methylthiotransferase accessory factor